MRIISFDAMRTLGIPGVHYVKPENGSFWRNDIMGADWLLFPDYWQVNGFYYGMKKAIFPSISTYHIGHDKVEMTRVVQLLWPGVMPETHILPNTDLARDWVPDRFDFPFVAKAMRGSMGDGVWLIRDHSAWLDYIRTQPVLYVQEYLPIDRDMRLVVIGRNVVAGYWRCRPTADGFHTNVAKGGFIFTGEIPAAAAALVEEMARTLDIDYAGFDIAEIDGRFYFFEFNRLFGTAGLIRQGIAAGPLIHRYLEEKDGRPENIPASVMPVF